MPALVPRGPVPDLAVDTVDDGAWRLSESRPGHFTMLVFYRGLHCPICKAYLRDLDRRLDDFKAKGVEVIAVSCDGEARARTARDDWHLERLPIGYGLGIADARAWGLYISHGIGKTSAGIEEPALFSEPGLFLVRPDGTLYAANVISMPFARPDFAAIDAALERIIARDYPARGEA
jgi:peroxiredoxin